MLPLCNKLFGGDAIVERMFRIEQQSQWITAVYAHFHARDIADFALVAHSADRAL